MDLEVIGGAPMQHLDSLILGPFHFLMNSLIAKTFPFSCPTLHAGGACG